MLTNHELAERLVSVALGKLTISQFEEWFVPCSWGVNIWGSPEMRADVYALELALAEYSNKHVDASYIRALGAEIADKIRNRGSILSASVGGRVTDADIKRARVPAVSVAAAA